MTIPTEPIGSIPRPLKLLEAINRQGSSHTSLEPLYEEAVRKTIEQFEATGSPVVTDGEQRKYHNFATYFVDGLPADNLPGYPREEFIEDLLDEQGFDPQRGGGPRMIAAFHHSATTLRPREQRRLPKFGRGWR